MRTSLRTHSQFTRRGLLAAALNLGALAACSPPTLWPRQPTEAQPTPAAIKATPTPRPAGVQLAPNAPALPGRLLFVSDADIWLLERSQLRRLTPDRISRQPAWSADGRRIVHVKLATSGSDLWVMDADGANSEELTDNEFRADAKQNFALRPLWWPDGSRLIYLSEEASQDTQLWQLTIASRRRSRFLPPIADRLGGLDTPKLSPDARSLAIASYQVGRGAFGRPQIWTIALPSGVPRQLTDALDGAYDPDWSPDGRRIAYTVRSGARHDIWVTQADGSGVRQVTTAGRCRAPAWSPDGSWLAYLSAQSGTFDVYAVAAPPDESRGMVGGPAATATPQPAFRQVIRNGLVDALSGLAWAA
jgi:TolB protein